MVEHLLAQGPGLNSPALGKMERKRKNESRREGKARGDQVGKVDTGYWGGGLEDTGLRVLGPPGGASTPCHTVTMPATSYKQHSYNRPHAQS